MAIATNRLFSPMIGYPMSTRERYDEEVIWPINACGLQEFRTGIHLSRRAVGATVAARMKSLLSNNAQTVELMYCGDRVCVA